jgi:hypothetical protein
MWMLSRGFALVLLGAAVQAQSVWLPAPSAETAAPAHRPSSTLVMSSVEARLAGTWPQGHAEFRYVAELVSAVRAAGADDERRGRRCASARFVAIQWQSPWCGVASELHAAATYRSPELPTGYRGPGGDPQSDQRQHGWMADAIGRSAGPEATEATSLHFAFVAMRDENVRDTAFGSMTEVFPMARAPRDVADQAEREATIEIGFGASVRPCCPLWWEAVATTGPEWAQSSVCRSVCDCVKTRACGSAVAGSSHLGCRPCKVRPRTWTSSMPAWFTLSDGACTRQAACP